MPEIITQEKYSISQRLYIKWSLQTFLLIFFICFIYFLTFVFFGAQDVPLSAWLFAVGTIFVSLLAAAGWYSILMFSRKSFTYRVDERGVAVGRFFDQYTTPEKNVIPYNHIKEVTTVQGPLDKIFAIATVKMKHTRNPNWRFATSSTIAGLSKPDAEALKSAILTRMRDNPYQMSESARKNELFSNIFIIILLVIIVISFILTFVTLSNLK